MFDPAAFLKNLDRCAVMGIVNITGDSFSEKEFSAPESAVSRALALFEDGADLLDLGAESTRPGSEEVCAAEECSRLLPVLQELRRRLPQIPLSVDTRHGETAELALQYGADIINDVSMGKSERLLKAVAAKKAGLVLCHSRGTPQDMLSEKYTSYPGGVRQEVEQELETVRQQAVALGVRNDFIWLDPGIGFAKTASQCSTLVAEAGLLDKNQLWLWGISRKSFMGGSFESRGPRTLELELQLIDAGASVIRTHDVRALRQAMKERG